MGLNYAVDKLHATGWTPDVTSMHERAPDGRPYPSLSQVENEFHAAGQTLSLKFAEKYGVFRAEWRDQTTGHVHGAVVGQTRDEAAVYALAQLRDSIVAQPA